VVKASCFYTEILFWVRIGDADMQDRIRGLAHSVGLVKRHFYDWWGLLACFTLILPAVNAVLSPLKNLDDLDESVFGFITGGVFQVLVNSTVIGLILGVWLVKRRIPRFRKRQIGVLFGPRYQDETAGEIGAIEEKLRDLTVKKDFGQNISVRRLPPNIKTGSHSENANIVARANARLLICGNFEEFTVKGKKVMGFTSLTVSGVKLPITPDRIPSLLSDALAGRQVGWDVDNTIDKNVVADNLSEVARYIAGLSMIADSRYEDAKVLFGPLFLDVKAKYRQRRLPIETKRFVATISDAYVVSLIESVRQRYLGELVKERIFQLDGETIHKWETLVREALRIKQEDSRALLLLAILRFLSNDTDGALEVVRKARMSTPPQAQAACDFSEAFLLAFKGRLREAKNLYKKTAENKYVPDFRLLSDVSGFLEQAMSAFPEKPEIQFLYGFLSDEFGDKTLAQKEFEEFVAKVTDQSDDQLKRWAREAKFRIERIIQK